MKTQHDAHVQDGIADYAAYYDRLRDNKQHTFTDREQMVMDWAAHHKIIEPAGDTREVCEALTALGFLEELPGHDPRFTIFKPTELGENTLNAYFKGGHRG